MSVIVNCINKLGIKVTQMLASSLDCIVGSDVCKSHTGWQPVSYNITEAGSLYKCVISLTATINHRLAPSPSHFSHFKLTSRATAKKAIFQTNDRSVSK